MDGPADAVNKAPTSAAADGSLGDMLLVRRSRLELEKEAAATAQAAHYGSPSEAGPSTGMELVVHVLRVAVNDLVVRALRACREVRVF